MKILTTGRAVKGYIENCIKNDLSPVKTITIAELFSRAVIASGKRLVDEDMKIMLLDKACDFEEFDQLSINREFLQFIKNYKFLSTFFNELAQEEVSIDAINIEKGYKEYAVHLDILKTVQKRYVALLSQHGLWDTVMLENGYTLNDGYLASIDCLEIDYEGYMSRHELSLLQKIAAVVPTTLRYVTSSYTKKMNERFSVFGTVEEGYDYLFDASNKTILRKEERVDNFNIVAHPFSIAISQVGYVQKKIYDFVNEGIDASKIAVILPDNELIPFLKLYDPSHNLNFAMGLPFSQTVVYQMMHAISLYISEDNMENLYRAKRFIDHDGIKAIAKTVRTAWDKVIPVEESLALLSEFGIYCIQEDIREQFDEVLFRLDKMKAHLGGYAFKEHYRLFLEKLSACSLDDTNGGKVTVMNVLETRGVDFDAIIVPNFNEGSVPSPVEKDLFLNTDVRFDSGLPTKLDRENLQRHYYHMLFSRVKKVAISFVKNEKSIPSHFLRNFPFVHDALYSETEFQSIMHTLRDSKLANGFTGEIVEEIDLCASPLSATKLKSYLTCKRQFYYKYVQKIPEPKTVSFMGEGNEVGNVVHVALAEVYKETPSFDNADTLYDAIMEKIHANPLYIKSDYFKIQLEIFASKIRAFAEAEVARFAMGVKVMAVETDIRITYGDIDLQGRIDRIDDNGVNLTVLDYKTGSYPIYTERTIDEATDFQMEFYYLLSKAKFGDKIGRLGYYDLNEAKIVNEQMRDQKLVKLDEVLAMYAQKEQNFSLREDKAECRYCAFKDLCGR